MKTRTPILKTYKLFIDGKSVRSESGRYFQIKNPLANVSQTSRKDLRNAIQAARKALPAWSAKTAYNRGQILYRMAEVLESRKQEFIQEIIQMTGNAKAKATTEVLKSIDRLVWYAGWSDKFTQLFSTVNPTALPYFNFTLPEPTGVVGMMAAEELPLIPLVSQLAPALVGGNTVVLLASEQYPLSAITFSEVLATSDLPNGVVNILTGFKEELLNPLAKHMDCNAICFPGDDLKTQTLLQTEGAANVKRIITQQYPRGAGWFDDSQAESPYWIHSLVEMKTTWHPIGV